MWKPFSVAIVLTALGLACAPAAVQADARLTDIENRWLSAGSPVLDYAEEQNLPIDIIVQPTARPGEAPLAMGFDGGRCKLVLSLRGNSDAESVLTGVEPAQANLAIEVMVAHEVAHCWRYLNGASPALLAGFSSMNPGAGINDAGNVRAKREMQQTRREEGFADLFGLAWTLRRHSGEYAQVHAWLEAVRENHAAPGGHHDTLAWIDLARNASIFDTDKTLFEQAGALWVQGLQSSL